VVGGLCDDDIRSVRNRVAGIIRAVPVALLSRGPERERAHQLERPHIGTEDQQLAVHPRGDDLYLHAAVAVVRQVLGNLAPAWSDRHDERARGLVVDRDRSRQEHRAPLSPQRDPHRVQAVRHDAALVVAAVPHEADPLTRGELLDAIKGHVIGQGELVALYERHQQEQAPEPGQGRGRGRGVR
jgi:hypothetical protein